MRFQREFLVKLERSVCSSTILFLEGNHLNFSFPKYSSKGGQNNTNLKHFLFPVGILYKIRQTVAGIRMTSQFHEFFKSYFLVGFYYLAQ